MSRYLDKDSITAIEIKDNAETISISKPAFFDKTATGYCAKSIVKCGLGQRCNDFQ